jgi:hypothetical protein
MNVTLSARGQELIYEAVGYLAMLLLIGIGISTVLVIQWVATTLTAWGI